MFKVIAKAEPVHSGFCHVQPRRETEEEEESESNIDLDAFENLKGLIPDPDAREAFAEMADLAKGFKAQSESERASASRMESLMMQMGQEHMNMKKNAEIERKLMRRENRLLKKTSVGFLYGAGAETRIFVTGASGKYLKIFVSQQKNQSQLWIHRKTRKIGVWVSGAEIPTSAVDTRTAVWVSTPEKIFQNRSGKTRNFSRKFRGVSAPALYKNPAVT